MSRRETGKIANRLRNGNNEKRITRGAKRGDNHETIERDDIATGEIRNRGNAYSNGGLFVKRTVRV